VDPARISEALALHPTLALDSCTLIYCLEADPVFGPAAEQVLRSIYAGRNRGIASPLALMELLVGPYRLGETSRANDFYATLHRFPNLLWVSLTCRIADRAAQLRGEYRIGAVDSVHLATALEGGATLFVTNDRGLPPVPGIDLLVLPPARRTRN